MTERLKADRPERLLALLRRGLPVAGVVLNGPEDPGLVDCLHACLPADVRVVAEIPPAPAATRPWVTANAHRVRPLTLRLNEAPT